MNNVPRPPTPVNEPVLGYLPGSVERIALKEELVRQSSEIIEIPCIINGVEVYTNDIVEQAESAINSGNIETARTLISQMADGEKFFVESLIFLSESDIQPALNSIEKCINAVRRPKARDPVLEARAKMIRGLARTSIGEITEGGADLRWSMDRLGAIATGSDEHGIAILNVAAWHRQQWQQPHRVQWPAILKKDAA